MPLNLQWQMHTETVHGFFVFSVFAVFFNVVFILFALTLVNLVLRRWASRVALSASELLIVYVMLSIGSGVFGHDLMLVLITHMTGLWFSTPENEYVTLFGRHFPGWLTLQDPKALRAYFEGGVSLYDPAYLRAWLVPAAAVGGFLIVLMGMFVCLNAVIRNRWTEHEKLSYPLTHVPLMLVDDERRALGGAALWAGFCVSGFISINGALHSAVPVIPAIRLGWDLGPYLMSRPWNALQSYAAGGFSIGIVPFVIGLSYFSPLNLAFSTWTFLLVAKAELVVRGALGIWATSGPFRSYPTAGAWIVLALYGLWAARGYFAEVLRSAWRGEKAPSEPMSYRTALLGIGIGTCLLVAFMVYAGMSAWVACGFLGIYVLYAVAIARIRAEVGPPAHDAEFMGPEQLLLGAFGSRRVGPRNIAILTRFYWMSRAYRSHPIGHQLEGFRMAEATGVPSRTFVVAILLAIVIATVTGFWAFLDNAYRYGGSNLRHNLGGEAFRRLEGWIRNPGMTDAAVVTEASIGAVVTIVLMALHRRFVGFPLHPVGYAVASGAMINGVWFSIFLSWALKWGVLKFGGIRQYRRTTPFFAGLVIGYAVFGCIALIVRVVVA